MKNFHVARKLNLEYLPKFQNPVLAFSLMRKFY